MVAAQLPLLPRYLRLKFSLTTWAFTFSWAAVASAALFWIASGHPSGERIYSYLVLIAISLLIGGVAARTVIAIGRDELLPLVPTAADRPTTAPVEGARATSALAH